MSQVSMITCSDSLEFLRKQRDYSFDINYSDPPYALGSEVIIRPDGKVDYKKANDFMNKWEMPTGEYWEQWFKEAYRTLKYGGYCIMFGMDRQLLLFKYYANLAGFTEQQSLYWYYISNFPKATDLSKMIDRNAGAERNMIEVKGNKNNEVLAITKGVMADNNAITDLAKKYNGYKYSISPLKQTNETILVFQKPYKTGSCLHDTLAYENGDDTCCCGALDIDGNRVGYDMNDRNPATNPRYRFENGYKIPEKGQKSNGTSDFTSSKNDINLEGRYPAQTFINSETAQVLDMQSGLLKQSTRTYKDDGENTSWFATPQNKIVKGDTGGCSKILHKCDYEEGECDLYFYNPKVSKSERNAGCDELDEKLSASSEFRPNHLEKTLNGEGGNPYGRWKPLKNNHPTLKPIKLNKNILALFKTPNEQRIVYPFAGSGSEIIGGIKAGFDNWTACELNQDYIDIANARIKFWKDFEGIELPAEQAIGPIGQINIWEYKWN